MTAAVAMTMTTTLVESSNDSVAVQPSATSEQIDENDDPAIVSSIAGIITTTTTTTSGGGTMVDEKEKSTGIFGRLFGRQRKEEPTIENGAADLLDDQRPENDDEETDDSSAESVAEEEESDDEQGEEAESKEGEGDEEEDESSGNYVIQRSTRNELASNYRDDDDEEDDNEMETLLGGSRDGNNDNYNPHGSRCSLNESSSLGMGFSKFFGVKPKTVREEEKNERQSLLYENNDDDDSDDHVDHGNNGGRLGLLKNTSSREKCLDAREEEDNEQSGSYHDDDLSSCGTREGEYRLESFYPTDSGQDCEHDYYNTSSRELDGRIHGFGSESSFAQNMAMMNGNNDFMMDTSFSDDQQHKGILKEVGRAVSNITQKLLRRGDGNDDDRRRMLAYIAELEWKLVQKEKELQSWKERAEELQTQVYQLQGRKSAVEKEESDNDEDDDEEEESQEDEEEDSLIDLLADDKEKSQEETEEKGEVTAKDGILIDITPKAPVFDPLLAADNNENNSFRSEEAKKRVTDDVLMDKSHYLALVKARTESTDVDHEDEMASGTEDETVVDKKVGSEAISSAGE